MKLKGELHLDAKKDGTLIPIRVALTGYGISGRVFHAPLLKASPFYDVCQILERTKNLSRIDFPEVKISRTYEDILNDDSIELIIINTPDKLHFQMAEEALWAEKHVVVEKPFTINLNQTKKLLNLAESSDLLITSYQNRRYDGDFLALQKTLKDNLLGEIYEFESNFGKYALDVSNNWRESNIAGYGILGNLGSHLIDQAVCLFGAPREVSCYMKKIRYGSRVPDYLQIHLHYESIDVNLKSSYLNADSSVRFRVHGQRGSFIIMGRDHQEERLKKKMGFPIDGSYSGQKFISQYYRLNTGDFIKSTTSWHDGDYGLFYDRLFHSIRFGNEAPVSKEHILSVMRVIEAAAESHRFKRTITLRS